MAEEGFTLLELLVTLFLIGLITLSATVIYQTPIQKGLHSKAKMDLVNLTNAIEEYYEQHHTYEGVDLRRLSYQPISPQYEFNLLESSQTAYKIAAIPKKSSADDPCQIFYLDQDGNTSVSGKGRIDECW